MTGEWKAAREDRMALNWEDFSEARGEDGLIHVVKKGEKNSLCGKPIQDGGVEGGRVCPLCRGLRREAITGSGE